MNFQIKGKISEYINLDFDKWWLVADKDFVHPELKETSCNPDASSVEQTLKKIQLTLKKNSWLMKDDQTVENLLKLGLNIYSNVIKKFNGETKKLLANEFGRMQITIIHEALKRQKKEEQTVVDFLDALYDKMHSLDVKKSVKIAKILFLNKNELNKQIHTWNLFPYLFKILLSYTPSGSYIISKVSDKLILRYRSGNHINLINLKWEPKSGKFGCESFEPSANSISNLIEQLQSKEIIPSNLKMIPVALMPNKKPRDF